MAGERMAPVVSGPLVAGGVDGIRAERPGDVIDAEFETLKPDPAERLLPPRAATPIGTAAAPTYGLDTLRKSYARGRAQAVTRGDPIFWTVGMFLVMAAFWISGGHALVSQSLIPAWHFTPANPLSIAGVTSRVEDRGGRAVLFVEGKALNAAAKEQPVPDIELRVTSNDGSVMRYSFKASSGPLPGGSAVAFSSRLEAPKEGVRSLTVNFQD